MKKIIWILLMLAMISSAYAMPYFCTNKYWTPYNPEYLFIYCSYAYEGYSPYQSMVFDQWAFTVDYAIMNYDAYLNSLQKENANLKATIAELNNTLITNTAKINKICTKQVSLCT